MILRAARLDPGLVGFLCLASAIWSVAWVLRPLLAADPRADVLAVGLTVDLAVVVPALFWALVVRRRRWPPAAVVPAFVASLGIATLFLPPDRRQALGDLELLLVPAELTLVAWIATRAVRGVRRTPGDLAGRIRGAAVEVLGDGRAARLVGYELTVLAYAASFGRRARASADAFPGHRAVTYGPVLATLLFITALEIGVVHLVLTLLGRPLLAWAASALGAYGALWLLGDWNALRLRPTRVEGDRLLLRVGLRWQAEIPLALVQAVRPVGFGGARDAFSAGLLRRPNVLLELSAPVELTGPYGVRRRAQRIALTVDAPAALARRLTRAG